MDRAKNIKKPFLNAGFNLIINKTNIKPSSPLKSLELRLTNSEIKYIMTVLRK